jgi:hypothetical protein
VIAVHSYLHGCVAPERATAVVWLLDNAGERHACATLPVLCRHTSHTADNPDPLLLLCAEEHVCFLRYMRSCLRIAASPPESSVTTSSEAADARAMVKLTMKKLRGPKWFKPACLGRGAVGQCGCGVWKSSAELCALDLRFRMACTPGINIWATSILN